MRSTRARDNHLDDAAIRTKELALTICDGEGSPSVQCRPVTAGWADNPEKPTSSCLGKAQIKWQERADLEDAIFLCVVEHAVWLETNFGSGLSPSNYPAQPTCPVYAPNEQTSRTRRADNKRAPLWCSAFRNFNLTSTQMKLPCGPRHSHFSNLAPP